MLKRDYGSVNNKVRKKRKEENLRH